MTDEVLPLAEFPSPAPSIQFHLEDVHLDLPDPVLMQTWLRSLISAEEGLLRTINFIFCSDDYLHQLNIEYLQHDTLTDVITFPYQAPPNVEGDIFISIDRVRDNARLFNADFPTELHRVMAHGILHLCGYCDKTPAAQALMRQKENEALALLETLRYTK